jgi:hypothetical protein
VMPSLLGVRNCLRNKLSQHHNVATPFDDDGLYA